MLHFQKVLTPWSLDALMPFPSSFVAVARFKDCIHPSLLRVWSIQFQSKPISFLAHICMMRVECSNGSDSYKFTKVQLFTRILLLSNNKPVPFGGNHPPSSTSSIDRSFAPLLPEAVYPKGEWLSIRSFALRYTGSRLNALWFPYCASWIRGSAGQMESWVTKNCEEIFEKCPNVFNIHK